MKFIISIIFLALIACAIIAYSGKRVDTARVSLPRTVSDNRPNGATVTRSIDVAGGNIQVALESGKFDLSDEALIDWVTNSARAVAAYYGRFPVRQSVVLIRPQDGQGVDHGSADTDDKNSASIKVYVGRSSRQSDLAEDWVLTHEMVHFGFPSLIGEHSWMEEGMATYVEPIARARVGIIKPEDVWGDLVRNLPEGLPKEGDQGLDNTDEWGRIYWGGALFCLLADIEIRERTGNRRGLEDAFRGIVAAGGTIKADWEITRALRAGDKAVGAPVLVKLYNRMKDKPVDVDLVDLWRQLGVEMHGDKVTFNDNAPLAKIRRAILDNRVKR
jgi:hypothetical protein